MEIRTCKETVDIQNLQKAADFVRAFVYGFEVEDALALVRLDDLFVDSFEIQVPVLEQVAPLSEICKVLIS